MEEKLTNFAIGIALFGMVLISLLLLQNIQIKTLQQTVKELEANMTANNDYFTTAVVENRDDIVDIQTDMRENKNTEEKERLDNLYKITEQMLENQKLIAGEVKKLQIAAIQ